MPFTYCCTNVTLDTQSKVALANALTTMFVEALKVRVRGVCCAPHPPALHGWRSARAQPLYAAPTQHAQHDSMHEPATSQQHTHTAPRQLCNGHAPGMRRSPPVALCRLYSAEMGVAGLWPCVSPCNCN
jgi:hypothetical protein